LLLVYAGEIHFPTLDLLSYWHGHGVKMSWINEMRQSTASPFNKKNQEYIPAVVPLGFGCCSCVSGSGWS
jgi:hypothetical protein